MNQQEKAQKILSMSDVEIIAMVRNDPQYIALLNDNITDEMIVSAMRYMAHAFCFR